MANLNEHEVDKTVVSKESSTDINGNTHTNLTRNTETVSNSKTNPQSYQQGYVQGRNNAQANLAERDDSNASRGLLLGIIFTSLIGLIAGAVWYSNQRNNEAVENAAPIVIPVPNKVAPSPAAVQSPPTQTTIIERTREVPVLVPQQQVRPAAAPSPPTINVTVPPAAAPSPPAVNVTVPPQRPAAAQKAPSATQTIPKEIPSPKTPISNTPVLEQKNDTSKTTAPKQAETSNSTSDSDSSTISTPSTPSSSGSTP
ncbi:hypothetical protein Cylst_5802 [Cylindrospermum stagnale PCC 7417]|uniref:Uncharacterized protein n=1 Tax=Cylindrospermum stagnale PCC 7417 TaxID=56107 RepID=K9X800_9NOST|nr:hypothetical protein [Cylindrospermum stagnale]AFZ27792.1 hypothetical protein Cylst_5802 [Cylindrospermum stagnale PCC 7417]